MKLLVLNPNSSQHMSKGAKKVLDAHAASLANTTAEVSIYTAPKTSPASIDDDEGIEASCEAVQADISSCFSVNPLVGEISELANKDRTQKAPVTGIFEASVLDAHRRAIAAHSTSASDEKREIPRWGIITTGKFWEKHLAEGVANYLQVEPDQNPYFAGVFSTGLNAGDFHNIDPDTVEQRLCQAVERLLDVGNVQSIVMGCAGMAGLEDIIRSAIARKYGDKSKDVVIIDGLKSGLTELAAIVEAQK
ncbi:hydantoin racemase [Ceratocystis lukuohia]|uniref:Hydantoin racemase n=1 Tax=Ceratocystis lukuohia TaxID=2019550 RepID=A0ABR4M9N2_9PEZI